MITELQMAALERGSRIRDATGLVWTVLALRDNALAVGNHRLRNFRLAGGPPPGGEIWNVTAYSIAATYSIERVSQGLYRRYKGDTYFVVGVGTLDIDGHGNIDAPRQVVYHSTRSVLDGLLRLHSEAKFLELVEWPDSPTLRRPRFERIDP